MKSSGAEHIDDQRSHQHFCYVVGHDFECSEDCECICGQPMNGNDHSECPIELRPCPKHHSEKEMSDESESEGVVEIKFPAESGHATVHCTCGCSDVDASEIVGWCLQCNHVYATYNPEIENRHFAYHCPGVPLELKQDALAKFGRCHARS
jgi:hypothetical protein